MDYYFLPFLFSFLILKPVAESRHGFHDKKTDLPSHQDLVTSLPGQPRVDFDHYAGYVTIDENKGRELFYWLFEAQTLPDEKPLVLWLNGGPGCSSVGYGATEEIGPFLITAGGLELNPYAWNKEANVLFLESPVGVGFSYSNTSSDYDHLGDDFTAQDSYTFLHKWFLKFPSYRTRPFYIAGESYAGKYIPELAEVIHDMNIHPDLFIDLKGILLGNPETNDDEDWKGQLDYAWSHAVISEETYQTIKGSCDFNSNDTNQDCLDAVDQFFDQYGVIDMYSLYTSVCLKNSSSNNSEQKSFQAMFRRSLKMMPRVTGGYDPCIDDYASEFYNRADVQKALHVTNFHDLMDWKLCNMSIFNGTWVSKPSMIPIHKKLIAAGIRVWVYSGDTDGRVPVLSTRYSIRLLDLPIKTAWRPWYHQEQVAGWVQEYEGLTYGTFRGAGHAVPTFKPSESLAFFSSFLSGDLPPSHS